MTEEHILKLLLGTLDRATTERLLGTEANGGRGELTEGACKVMNMGRSLLETIIPHVLRKVDRVTYGLLQARDIAHADPNMPHSRTQVRNNLINTFILTFNTYNQPINTQTAPPMHTDRCAFRRQRRSVPRQ